MPKFAANLSMLFTEIPFMERFSQASQAGFTAIEYLFPYEWKASEIKQQLVDNGLTQVLFNLPPGNWGQGDRGIASHPERVAEFRAGVDTAVEYALELGVTQLNCLAGKKCTGYDEAAQWALLVDNVRYAAHVLQKQEIRLVVEAINHYDMPGFLLNRTDQVVKLLEEVGMPNVYMQYDVYHAQREEGEIIATLRKNIAKISHIQIADNPGRHQPGTGEINYPNVLKEIDALGYAGYVGLEYIPQTKSLESFHWLDEYGYQR